MPLFRHRPLGLPPLALVLAITVAGCSSADDTATAAVPSPDATVTELCGKLDDALPATVAGQDRDDPEPASALTAGWGRGPAIILRCGVIRPPKMIDPKVAVGGDADAVAGGVDGVDWLQEKADDGAFRFTTASRVAYVEVAVDGERAGDSAGVLVALAPAIKSAIPEGIAD
ncbi:DUF3515 domain-containing protein [Streptomyces sp. NPDC093252]|uniref:DUF3515 domain-containing protein n=1 Tax=Streptomyces sp. NPDC093252 TaxID=3154980 RepID=UPI00341486BA